MATFFKTLVLFVFACPGFMLGQPQAISLKDVPNGLPVISADEPMAAEFSAEKAAQYLDRSALNWQKTKECATCHTNLFYMIARPALSKILPDSGEVRTFYEDYRKVRWQKNPPTQAAGFWPIVVGTGLVIVIARELGIPAEDERLQRGIKWIRSNQRESGKWFTKSPVNDAGNLISNVGSAYVVLALQSCGELPGWPFSPIKLKGN